MCKRWDKRFFRLTDYKYNRQAAFLHVRFYLPSLAIFFFRPGEYFQKKITLSSTKGLKIHTALLDGEARPPARKGLTWRVRHFKNNKSRRHTTNVHSLPLRVYRLRFDCVEATSTKNCPPPPPRLPILQMREHRLTPVRSFHLSRIYSVDGDAELFVQRSRHVCASLSFIYLVEYRLSNFIPSTKPKKLKVDNKVIYFVDLLIH